MMIPQVFWLVPIASIVALGMAYYFFTQMMKADEGTPRMKEIALYVRKGAMAYLKQQYKVVGIVFAVLCVLFAFNVWKETFPVPELPWSHIPNLPPCVERTEMLKVPPSVTAGRPLKVSVPVQSAVSFLMPESRI